jgi:hypothetical protein
MNQNFWFINEECVAQVFSIKNYFLWVYNELIILLRKSTNNNFLSFMYHFL